MRVCREEDGQGQKQTYEAHIAKVFRKSFDNGADGGAGEGEFAVRRVRLKGTERALCITKGGVGKERACLGCMP